MNYLKLTVEELLAEKEKCSAELQQISEENLNLDLSRGKPSKEQLELSLNMLDVINHNTLFDSESGMDCRNYGGLDGIPEAKQLMASIMNTHMDNVIIGGNSSLTLMYQLISHGMTEGICGNKPWYEIENRKFLCPVPGYDRHFAICENFGIEMINIPTDENGPDMDMVEKLVSSDESVKGIWCVPQYANPTGYVYSDEVVKRFAALKPKAADFRIFWDNAYCIHHVSDTPKYVLNLMDECRKTGNEDILYTFGSTSKVTFPGAGVAALGTSKNNISYLKKVMGIRTIGYDKINQLRHVRFFGTYEGILEHMEKHRAILKPKFDAVIDMLEKEIAPLGIGSWTNPDGGYFISFDSLPGCAKRIVELCKEAGVTLTGAGATYPYGKDPEDKNIRIAPTYPSVDELTMAMEIFCLAVKIASAEKVL